MFREREHLHAGHQPRGPPMGPWPGAPNQRVGEKKREMRRERGREGEREPDSESARGTQRQRHTEIERERERRGKERARKRERERGHLHAGHKPRGPLLAILARCAPPLASSSLFLSSLELSETNVYEPQIRDRFGTTAPPQPSKKLKTRRLESGTPKPQTSNPNLNSQAPDLKPQIPNPLPKTQHPDSQTLHTSPEP